VADTGGAQRHPGDTEQLFRYWTEGKGAAKIQWFAEGSYTRCLTELGKYVPPGQVHGLCANLYHRAVGRWPGAHNDHHLGNDGGAGK
jgi:hypothetical protein